MCKMKYYIWILSFVLGTAQVFPQINFQLREITDIINNITMTEIATIVKRLPLPNPLTFDGLPLIYNDVNYYLYTRKNPEVPELLKRSYLKSSSVNPDHEVKLLTHGWLENANRTYLRELTKAYLKRGEYNVIVVDWQRPAQFDYTIASRNTKSVGKDIGEFILRMMKVLNIPLKKFHFLGHSLGAHVAGFAGKEVFRRLGKKIGRITALDAAGPLFEMPVPVDEDTRLSKRDADFVDCIHTDGGIFGMTKAIGHVDFYPNGGIPRQPGCSSINIAELETRVIFEDMFCSHSRSHELYVESINSVNTRKFRALECDSYQNFKAGRCRGRSTTILGEDVDQKARGSFFLDINNFVPSYNFTR